MEHILSIVGPYLPYIGVAVPFVLGIIALAIQGKLDDFVRETVAAAYRVGIHAASVLETEGIAWLKSDAGIAYRKQLACEAYELIPARIGAVPVGLVKLYLSEEQFCALVEAAFQRVVELSEQLEAPEVKPTA